MNNSNEFTINNGVLEKYYGVGGDIVIPVGVTAIAKEVFLGCESLTSVVIPNSVTSIGSGAFIRCRNLELAEIPDSVTSIGFSAFYFCKKLPPETANKIKSINKNACE